MGGKRTHLVTLQRNPVRDNMDTIFNHLQPILHGATIILAWCNPCVYLGSQPGKFVPRFGSVGFTEGIQKGILALQGANHLHPEPTFNGRAHTKEQGVRQTNDIRLTVLLQPVNQRIQLTRLTAIQTPQHGNG